MKFGLFFANTGPYGTVADSAKALGTAAEAAGFESVWTVEHVVVPKGYESTYPYDPSGRMPGPEDSPIPDPLIWLSYLAAATTTLKPPCRSAPGRMGTAPRSSTCSSTPPPRC